MVKFASNKVLPTEIVIDQSESSTEGDELSAEKLHEIEREETDPEVPFLMIDPNSIYM